MSDRQGNRWATDPKLFAGVVGEAVRRHRQSLGYTQVQLAEAAGLSPNYVARLERGELGPSLFVAHLLARTLGVEIGELCGASQPTTGRRRIAG
ncbi:MAG: helix-turn-helix domain-containing protein [Polyangiaceae bacterium]|jgi:transcriptional regulator with XRE-family HTH domain